MAYLVWITGLSGSGKTTIATEVYTRLKQKHPNIVHLDGDKFREILGNDKGHNIEHRLENARRISRMCLFLVSQDINVICSTISLFDEVHKHNRNNFSKYLEVFLHCDLNELERRDQKGLYSGSKIGKTDIVGVDLPYDKPHEAELSLVNNKPEDKIVNINKILQYLEEVT